MAPSTRVRNRECFCCAGLIPLEALESRRLLAVDFFLINAETNQRIMQIGPGETIDRVQLPTRQLNIEAVLTGKTKAASARMWFDDQTRRDNSRPYSALGDEGGRFAAGEISLGWHAVTLTPYPEKSCQGTPGTSFGAIFEVIDSSRTAVSSVQIVDAVHDRWMGELIDGATVDLARLTTPRLNFQAATSPGKVGSVRFVFDDEPAVVDDVRPYSAFGDVNGDFVRRVLPPGEHQLTVQTFSQPGATGQAGRMRTYQFNVIDSTNWARISGHVYEDVNGNGMQDRNEPGAADREVVVRNPEGQINSVAITDENGAYEFAWPGDFDNPPSLLVKTRAVDGWRVSQPEKGYFRVSLTPGLIAADKDIGVTQVPAASGIVFKDLNGNGVRDSQEPAAPNVIVWDDLNRNERRNSGEAMTRTAADGSYRLPLTVGRHYLTVAVAEGWRISSPREGWISVDTQPGSMSSDVSFAITQQPAPGIMPRFEWSMPDRYGVDSNNNGLTDLPNSVSYVNPGEGYSLWLDASSTRIDPALGSVAKYRWTLTDTDGQYPMVKFGQQTSFDNMPQGRYRVRLTVITSDGSRAWVEEPVQVRDVLIVSLGDSFASGEGVPERNLTKSTAALWADGVTPEMTRENRQAHRSTLCAASQAAIALEKSSPHFSVTYVQLSASGAETRHLLTDSKDGIEIKPYSPWQQPEYTLKPQIPELAEIVRDRPIDILTISIGGNDIGFGNLITDLLLRRDGLDQTDTEKAKGPFGIEFITKVTKFNHPEVYKSLQDVLGPAEGKMAGLFNSYASIQAALADSQTVLGTRYKLQVRNTYITEYPDPTTGDNRSFQAFGSDVLNFMLPVPAMKVTFTPVTHPVAEPILIDYPAEIDAGELAAVQSRIIRPLNNTVAAAAQQQGWTCIRGIADAFAGHGYAATEHWFRRMSEARDTQGVNGLNLDFTLFGKNYQIKQSTGGFHPNDLGHKEIAEKMLPFLKTKVSQLLDES